MGSTKRIAFQSRFKTFQFKIRNRIPVNLESCASHAPGINLSFTSVSCHETRLSFLRFRFVPRLESKIDTNPVARVRFFLEWRFRTRLCLSIVRASFNFVIAANIKWNAVRLGFQLGTPFSEARVSFKFNFCFIISAMSHNFSVFAVEPPKDFTHS